MTADQVRAFWARWSHRSDLAADMAVIEELAGQRIRDRMMQWYRVFELPEDISESMADAPALWCAAGLIEIHRLAEDEAGLAREGTMFEQAAADYIMRLSLRMGPAIIGIEGADYGN